MVFDPQIQGVIDLIDKRIANLQKTKEMLLSEFGGSIPSAGMSPLIGTPPSMAVSSERAGTRKQQIAAFLRENGPTKRQDIVSRLSIPVGTVAYVLNDDMFEHDSEGRWSVRSGAR